MKEDEKLLSTSDVETSSGVIYRPNWFELSELDKSNYDKCSEILDDLNKHMREYHTEKSAAFNYQTKVSAIDVGTKTNEVKLSKEIIKLLKNSKENTVVLMHCHPNETPFSFDDLLKLRDYKSVKMLIVECPSGKKYIMNRGKYKQTFFTSQNKDIFSFSMMCLMKN